MAESQAAEVAVSLVAEAVAEVRAVAARKAAAGAAGAGKAVEAARLLHPPFRQPCSRSSKS